MLLVRSCISVYIYIALYADEGQCKLEGLKLLHIVISDFIYSMSPIPPKYTLLNILSFCNVANFHLLAYL